MSWLLRASKPALAGRSSFRPVVEQLEERATPTTLPAGFQESLIASNIGSTTAMALAPDGRVFVATQTGALRVVKDGALLATPFLQLNVDSAGERGLLGVAFDPGFGNVNNYLYVYYTVPGGGVHNRVSRFVANGDVVQAGSEKVLLELDPLSSATNHNGGAMHFGADGKLYVAVGENANPGFSQTLGNLLGKVLRLDVSSIQASDPANSAKLIPPGNPFVNQASGINQLIYALGLRNPFTFGVQPGTGVIYINDVGQGTWEEVNQLVAGANYGWGLSEGFASAVPPGGLGPGTYRDPLLAYNHSGGPAGGGIAIVGGAFYNPAAGATNPFPSSYVGQYFYADLGSGWIRTYNPSNPGNRNNPDTSAGFATGTIVPVDITLAPDGGIYYLARGSNGALFKISYGNAAPTITQQPSNVTVSPGEMAVFTVAASGQATLTYQWQRNNVNITGATAASYALANPQAADQGAQFRVVVTNGAGLVTSNAATLTVTSNQAPTPTITISSGLRNGRFDAGTPITFSLSAADPEDGTEPASRFTYRVDYITSLNATPGGVLRPFVQPTPGQASGTFTPASSGPYTLTDVAYRITFTVTDSGGRSSTTTRDILPNTSVITLQTDTPGLELNIDGQTQAAPVSFASVVGFQRFLVAPTSQTANGLTHNFVSWSDGGAASHAIATSSANTTYTAAYQQWTSWASLSGFVKQIASGTNADGGVVLFGIGGDNAAWMRIQAGPDGAFGNWTSLGGFVKQLVVGRDGDGRLLLFAIGGDNAAWVRIQTTAGEAFANWTSLGGFVKQLAVGTNDNGALTLFGIGGDNAAWMRTQVGPSSFANWTSLGGYVKQLVAAQNTSGGLSLFAIGGDNAAWVRAQTGADGPFAGWASLGGFVKQLTVGTNDNGSLSLFAIGGDNAAWMRTQSGAEYTNWSSLGGFVQQLDVGRNADGTLSLLAIGRNNAAFVRTQTAPDGIYADWVSLNGFVKQLVVAANGDETLYLLTIGGDNAAWWRKRQSA